MITVTKADLVDQVRDSTGLARIESAGLVDQLLQLLRQRLLEGEEVKLTGFGSFLVRRKARRPGRNPKTLAPLPIAPRRVVVFRPSALLRQAMNTGSTGTGGKGI